MSVPALPTLHVFWRFLLLVLHFPGKNLSALWLLKNQISCFDTKHWSPHFYRPKLSRIESYHYIVASLYVCISILSKINKTYPEIIAKVNCHFHFFSVLVVSWNKLDEIWYTSAADALILFAVSLSETSTLYIFANHIVIFPH